MNFRFADISADFNFKVMLGYESGAQMGSFDEYKQRSKLSCKCTFQTEKDRQIDR